MDNQLELLVQLVEKHMSCIDMAAPAHCPHREDLLPTTRKRELSGTGYQRAWMVQAKQSSPLQN